MKKLLFTFLFIISIITPSLAQDINARFFTSPDAAAISKYIDFPPANHTGIIQMSIPLYEVKLQDFTLPISLSYHAGGIKVEETASNIGLGWSLNAGGNITRAVNGIPDDFNREWKYGWIGCVETEQITVGRFWAKNVDNLKNFDGDSYDWDYFTNAMAGITTAEAWNPWFQNGNTDLEPDLFYLNHNELSGQFIFDSDNQGPGSIKLIPYQDIRVTPTFDKDGKLSMFIVNDTKGNIYYFEEIERVYTNQTSNLQYKLNGDGWTTEKIGAKSLTLLDYNTSWQISKIITAKRDTIKFSYKPQHYHTYTYDPKHTSIPFLKEMPEHIPISNENHLNVYSKAISKIETCKEEIVFEYDDESPRLDIGAFYKVCPVSRIVVKDKFNGETIKDYSLYQSYFENSEENDVDKYRLKLMKVEEKGTGNYSFKYDERTPLPKPGSYQQDAWGYFNGADNENLIPTTFYYPENTGWEQFSFFDLGEKFKKEYSIEKADRTANPNVVTSGMLTQITYPTGGRTEYEYESNRFAYMGGVWNGGGIRIKSIKKYDAISSTPVLEQNYEYSIGKPMSIPHFAEFAAIYREKIFLKIQNKSFCQLGTTQGGHVCYEQVTINTKGNGKTVLQYNCPATYGEDTDPDGIFNASKVKMNFFPNYEYDREEILKYFSSVPIPPNPNYDWSRGQLLSEKIYDVNNNLLKESDFKYKNYFPNTKANAHKIYGIVYNAYVGATTNPYLVFYCKYDLLTDVAKVLDSKIETLYDPNSSDSITTKVEYKYSPNNLNIASEKIIDSKGSEHETSYRYLNDIVTNDIISADNPTAKLYKKIWTDNMVQIPFETIKKTDNKVTMASVNRFKELYDKILPAEEKAFTPSKPVSDYQSMEITDKETFDPRLQTKVSYDEYDEKGNLIQYTTNEGIPTTILWGYRNNYPIAKIINSRNNTDTTISRPYYFETEIHLSATGINKGQIENFPGGQINVNLNVLNPSAVPNLQEKGITYTIYTTEGKAVQSNCCLAPENNPHYCDVQQQTHNLPKGSYYIEFNVSRDLPTNVFSVGVKAELTLWENKEKGGIFYESFENSNGGFIDSTGIAAAGERFYTGYYKYTPQFTLSGDQECYIDYKYRNASGKWLYKRIDYTPETPIQEEGAIDEIRIYPKGAQITTYTYRPLFGVSSETDPNGLTTHYEYDSFGRLYRILDNDRNIIKQYKYHYKN